MMSRLLHNSLTLFSCRYLMNSRALLRITVLLYYVQVRVAVGQTVLILASQHLQTVINTLVNQPLPYDK